MRSGRIKTANKLKLLLAAIFLCGLASFWVIDMLCQQQSVYRAVRRGDLDAVQRELIGHPDAANKRSPMLGVTPLHVACERGNSDIVNLLLQSGADPNAERESKLTPLQLACFHGNAKIAELLIAHGANVNHHGWRHHNTPLQVAATHGYIDVVTLLINHGAELDYRDMLGLTAMDIAREEGFTNIAELLSSAHKQP